MKLLYCMACGDIIAIHQDRWRFCRCGKSKGRYLEDGWHSEFHGFYAMPIGLSNPSLVKAVLVRGKADVTEEELKLESWVFGSTDSQRIQMLKDEDLVSDEELYVLRELLMDELKSQGKDLNRYMEKNGKFVGIIELSCKILESLCRDFGFNQYKMNMAGRDLFIHWYPRKYSE